MFQRRKSVNPNGCLYRAATVHNYHSPSSSLSPSPLLEFSSLRCQQTNTTTTNNTNNNQHNRKINNSNSSSCKSLPCWMTSRRMITMRLSNTNNNNNNNNNNSNNERYTLRDDDDDDDDVNENENEHDDDVEEEDDWKYYTRFSIGSMSSDSTTCDIRKNVSSLDYNQSKESYDDKNDAEYHNSTFHHHHHQQTPPPPPLPPVSSSSLNILSSSWSVYVCHQDSDVIVSSTMTKKETTSTTTTTTVFRLVRNSESSSALYLFGMEIIHSIDAIYHRDHTVTFTIFIQNSNNNNIEEIYVANEMTDIHNKLYSCMVPSEITFQPRPQRHSHVKEDDISWLHRKTKFFGTSQRITSGRDDRARVFRFSAAEYRDLGSISSISSCDLDLATTVQQSTDRIPIIESKMEFDDDDDDDECFDNIVESLNCGNTGDVNRDLWDNTMIHDVVSSLIAIGIHDTSMSTSLWTTLSSSSPSFSSSLYSSDNDDDNRSERKRIDI